MRRPRAFAKKKRYSVSSAPAIAAIRARSASLLWDFFPPRLAATTSRCSIFGIHEGGIKKERWNKKVIEKGAIDQIFS